MKSTLVNVAIADAYAMAWEFVEPAQAPVNDWSGYRPNPNIASYVPSKYSDDTMRSLINARVILERDPLNQLDYVRVMKEEVRNDPRIGWSRGFRAYLAEQADRPDDEWFSVIRPRNTNGGVMGAAVCGFLDTPRDVIGAAITQALITHDEEAATYAAACAMAFYGARTTVGDLRDLHAYVCSHVAGLSQLMPDLPLKAPDRSMLASDAYATALRILGECNDFRGILDRTIVHGGDTDSVASIAVAIASGSPDFDANYPGWALDTLECGDLAALDRLVRTGSSLAKISRPDTEPGGPGG